MPVTLPLETIKKRDSSVMVMPAGLRCSAAITSNFGNVVSKPTRSRSRSSASMAREVRSSRSHRRSLCLLAGSVLGPELRAGLRLSLRSHASPPEIEMA